MTGDNNMKKREKNLSLNFYDDEIHHIEITDKGEKIIHLHPHVHRTYNPYLLDYDQISHRNQYLDYVEKVRQVYLKLYGGDDFSDQSED